MSSITDQQAAAIAPRVNLGFVIPPEIITGVISLLISYLGSCWKTTPPAGGGGPVSPSEYVDNHYDPTTCTYDESLLGAVRGQTRRAIRQQHRSSRACPPLNQFQRSDVDSLSIQTLEHIRNTPQVAASCLAEVDN